MQLYNWLTEMLLPIFGDISATEGALDTFGNIFWFVLSCCVVHFVVYVPYRAILKLIHWKRWRE